MKLIKLIGIFLILASLGACVTGNDDNAVLSEHEEAIARTPRVLDLTVDGVAPSRDETSHWLDFEVDPGQQLLIRATYNPGNGASSAMFDFSRTYNATSHDPDAALPVEPMTDRVTTLGSESMNFEFTYTVPTMVNDSTAFGSGDHINLTWLSSNNLGGQGFNDINLIYR